jgi:predicted RNA-binding Zn-ribbon protein involved in translation (DUF1610 family)
MSNFGDLINIDEYGEKREQFNEDRWGIAYYCKDCKQITEVNNIEKKSYKYTCKNCDWIDIVIGTLEWLKSNYKIK